MFTCRTIANETRDLPLSVNTVTFSTLYREDWRSLAGCFNVVTAYYRRLEADLVLRLAEFMTPKMYGWIALKYPNFANQLEAVPRNHRLEWSVHNNRRANEVMAAESGSGDERTRDEVERLKGMRCCMSLQGFLNIYVNSIVFYKGPDQSYAGFSGVHRLRETRRPSKFGPGSDSEIRDALSYYLRLIADKKPVQFANHLRTIFPRWIGPDIVESFLCLRFDNWDIPSEGEVKNAIRLLDIDGIWEFPDRWHSKPPPRAPDSLLERDSDEDDSDNGSNGDQDDDQDDEDDICEHDTNDYNHCGLQCREKIRFSAAANAIRFLKRIAGQRIHLKDLVLHEDFDSVNDPHTHARGLAPFVKENPSLLIVRRVNMLDCIVGLSPPPADSPSSVAWYRAYKLLNARGIFHDDEMIPCTVYDGSMIRDEDAKAINKLVNQTSGVLSADFNTCVSLDAQALAKETEDVDSCKWVAKWRQWGSLKRELPPALNYDRLADLFEFRTDDDQLAANPQSAQLFNQDS
ncbi:hypothetical protein F25303_4150 [Fusarium sp. NRRL 25303]|nr:hypothetical protein F25303_4150 [Fusarium sp. NRRL 25303]